MQKLYVLLICFLCSTLCAAQNVSPTAVGVEWLTFEDAVARNEKNPKKIFLDVYTDWCGWCKVMDSNTFSDAKVAEYMGTHFYAVKLDAEGKSPISFMGNVYNFSAQYRSHELAMAILSGKMSYPSTAYMDGKNQLLTVVPGYMTPTDFMPILVFFGDDHYLKMTWEEFQEQWPALEKTLAENSKK